MLLIHKPAPNRIDIDFSAPLDAEMMRLGLDELMEKSEGVTHGMMLYRIPEFAMPTFGAIMVEMARLHELFGLLGRFDRCAVLTDAGWVQTEAAIEGAILPRLEVKSFALEDEAAAEAWLARSEPEDEAEFNGPI